MVEGGSTNGNVLTGVGGDGNAAGADTPGADDLPASPVVGVAAGDTDANLTGGVGVGGTGIAGTYGTLVLNADGTYTYTATAGTNPPPNATDTFTYTIVDNDGNLSNAELVISVIDDKQPVAGQASAKVDDEGLSGGILGGTGDIDANSGEVGAGSSDEKIWTGTLGGTDGDGTTTFLFQESLESVITDTLGTETLSYVVSADGLTLQAFVEGGPRDGAPLFTVVITNADTGAYTVTLHDNVLHAAGGNDETSDTLVLPYQMKDADNDLSASPGQLTITFNDDMPTAVSAVPVTTGLDNGGGDSITQSLDSDDGDVFDNFGADGGKVIFNAATVAALELRELTHDTQALSYHISADGQTLIGFVNENADEGYQDGTDTPIFTIVLQPGNSSDYTVTMHQSLDSISDVDFDDGSYDHKGGNPDYYAFFQTGENDSSDLLITPMVGGATTGSINLNSNLFGVSGGNSVGANEAVRLDFVTDYVETGDDIGDWTFEGHYTTNGASVGIGSTPGSTVRFTARIDQDTAGEQNVGGGDLQEVTGVAISYNGGTSGLITLANDDDMDGIVEASDSDGIANVTVGGRAFTVKFNNDGTVDVGNVTGTSNGSVLTTVAVFTDDGYNSLEVAYVSGSAFLVGNFGAAVETTDPVDFNVPISVVDGDGDTVSSGNIAIHVTTPEPAPFAMAMTSLAMEGDPVLLSTDDSSASSRQSIAPSNDNGDTSRSFVSGNQAAMMGALAAAGLTASHQVAARDFDFGNDDVSFGQVQGLAAVSGPAEGGGAAVSQIVEQTPLSEEKSDDDKSNSNSSKADDAKKADNDDDGAETQEVSALAEGTEAEQSEAAAVTADAVAMPSMEMVAALEAESQSVASSDGAIGRNAGGRSSSRRRSGGRRRAGYRRAGRRDRRRRQLGSRSTGKPAVGRCVDWEHGGMGRFRKRPFRALCGRACAASRCSACRVGLFVE